MWLVSHGGCCAVHFEIRQLSHSSLSPTGVIHATSRLYPLSISDEQMTPASIRNEGFEAVDSKYLSFHSQLVGAVWCLLRPSLRYLIIWNYVSITTS